METVAENREPAARPAAGRTRLKFLSIGAALVVGATAMAAGALARAQANGPASPYGGSVVEDIIARVNDQIITKSDYDRAMDELDQEDRQRGESMQQMSDARRNLLRNLIDQQLWLSKGKEMGITGETDLIKRLDDIRKQYHLDSIEALQQEAEKQGVSFEDFKANIRNQIITQDVMRQEVGAHINMTPGEVEQYYEAHKQDYTQPESVRLSEILVSTGNSDDPAKVAAAKAKAVDIEARLHAGGSFAQLARTFSNGPTAAEGGNLGQYQHGQLGKVLEDKVFVLKSGQYTDPILTRQGYIILRVDDHAQGGPRPFKDVEQDVEQAYYMSRMEPAIRSYLNKMRDEAFIQIRQGYADTGTTYAEMHSSIAFSAYVPPAPKKKAKVERTRFRESTRAFRQKSGAISQDTTPAKSKKAKKSKKNKKAEQGTEKPGKPEKIRYGQAPLETLPTATYNSATEDAGALPAQNSAENLPSNPLEPQAPTTKTRFSARARVKKQKGHGASNNVFEPAEPDAAEVSDREMQSAPLGLNGATAQKKKKRASQRTAEKTRMSQQKKQENNAPVQQPTPIPQVAGAPAPGQAAQQPQQ